MTETLTHQTSWKVIHYIFRSKLHHDIITISKLDTVWICHSQGGKLFSGEKFTEQHNSGGVKHMVSIVDSLAFSMPIANSLKTSDMQEKCAFESSLLYY